MPEEMIKSFSKILGKFFDAESEDNKKEVEAKVPNYSRLLEKAGDKDLDFALTSRLVELDRDADRRYLFATRNIKKTAEKGEPYPQSSPMMKPWEFKNDDAESARPCGSCWIASRRSAATFKVRTRRLGTRWLPRAPRRWARGSWCSCQWSL